jgi:hypothetical protein
MPHDLIVKEKRNVHVEIFNNLSPSKALTDSNISKNAKQSQIKPMMTICRWVPENFLNAEKLRNCTNFAIIVLNRPINGEREIVESLWNHGEI